MEFQDAIAAIDRFVHAELHRLYESIKDVYPIVDTDAAVDGAFLLAAAELDSAPQGQEKWWLLGLARRFIDDSYRSNWRRRNARAIVQSIRTTAVGLTDWHLWIDTTAIIKLVERLSVADQEILQLITCFPELDPLGLSLVLGISYERALRDFERVSIAFRADYFGSTSSGSRGVSDV